MEQVAHPELVPQHAHRRRVRTGQAEFRGEFGGGEAPGVGGVDQTGEAGKGGQRRAAGVPVVRVDIDDVQRRVGSDAGQFVAVDRAVAGQQAEPVPGAGRRGGHPVEAEGQRLQGGNGHAAPLGCPARVPAAGRVPHTMRRFAWLS